MAELVSKAVETAVNSMKQALTELLKEGQASAMGKQGEDLSVCLEGRVNRSRETQEQMINLLRNEQLKFQSEIRSTVTTMKPITLKLGISQKALQIMLGW